MNYAAFPYLRIAVLFITGIITGETYDFPFRPLYGSIFLLVLIYMIAAFGLDTKNLRKSTLQNISLILLIYLTGIASVTLKKENLQNKIPDKLLHLDINFEGIIEEPPVIKNRIRCMINISRASWQNENWKPEGLKIVAYFTPEDSLAYQYNEGDLINFTAKLRPIPKGSNPSAFDFSSYLRYRSVILQTNIPRENHKLIKSGAFFFFRAFAADLRHECLSILHQYIRSEKELAIAQAVLLGYRNLISDELYQDFTDSGAVHVLAVSGLHVAIVISFFIFLLDKIKSRNIAVKLFKIITLTLLVWLYVCMTGASPAVVRAGVMVTIFLIGKYTGGSTNIYNILSLSAILMLLFDPFLLFQASFQFSFLALISIVFFQPYIQNIWAPENKLIQYGWNLVSVAIAAQILVFPVTIYYFHKFPAYFMLTGLVAIPLVLIILYAGLLMLAVEFILPGINEWLAPLLGVLLEIFVKTIRFIKSLPFSSIRDIWIDDISMLLMYGVIFTLMYFATTARKKCIWAGMALVLILGIRSGILTIHQQQQKKIFIYDVYGGTLTDYFDGNECYTILSGKVDQKAVSFAAQNNRMRHGIQNVTDISQNAYFKNGSIEKFENLVSFANYRTLYFNPDFNITPTEQFPLDLVIPVGNCADIVRKEIQLPSAGRYMLGRNIPPWVKANLKDMLQGQKIHDIAEKGALHIVMKSDSD